MFTVHGPARRRLPYLFPAIVVFAVLEFWLVVKVGVHIGAGQTLLLIICGSVLGIVLVKTQWRGVVGRMQAQVAAGIMPSNALGDTLGLLLAGVLLVIPGFITDVAGLVLMLPFVRHAAAKYILKRMPLSGQAAWPGFGQGFTVHSWTFDGERTSSASMHSSESGENIVEAEFEEIVRERDAGKIIDVTPREPDSSGRN